MEGKKKTERASWRKERENESAGLYVGTCVEKKKKKGWG